MNEQSSFGGCGPEETEGKVEINSEKAIHHLLNNADFHTPLQNMEN